MRFDGKGAEGRRGPRWILTLLFLLLPFWFLYGCGTAPTPRYAPTAGYPIDYVERGVASWYGPGFHGRKTANGETFNTHRMTAAHRTLPMGSVVLVRSLTNGKTVTVRINDRGPFAKGRILDLSQAGAQALGMIGTGTDRVEIRVIAYEGRPGPLGYLRVQVASFAEKSNAQALAARLRGQYTEVSIEAVELPEGRRYRVKVGRFTTEQQAETIANRLTNQLEIETLVVRDDA